VEPLILIGHNIRFDRRFLDKYLPTVVGSLCTLRLARRLLPTAEEYKLTTLKHQFGLSHGEAHRALGDVETCYSLLRLCVDVSEKTLDELVAEETKPRVLDPFPFGKHKGKSLRQVPRSYAEWALEGGMTDIDMDVKHTLMVIAGRAVA